MNNKLFNEFINSEDLETYKNNNFEKYTNYVTDSDLKIIFENIDKTDYTYMGCSRWMNLDNILDTLINKKINNPNIELSKLGIISMHETFPPQIKYYLAFNNNK
jgi:hypothetical protein